MLDLHTRNGAVRHDRLDSHQAERLVVGAMLRDADAAALGQKIISAESFSQHPLRLAYETIVTLLNDGRPTDTAHVLLELQKHRRAADLGSNPADYLWTLFQECGTAAVLEPAAAEVRQAAAFRQLLRIGLELQRDAEDIITSPEQLVSDFTTKLSDAAATYTGPQTRQNRFRFVPLPEFLATDSKPKWAVKNVVVRGQPLVFAGASKTLKTNSMLDLAVSCAGCRPFLNRFDVVGPDRVMVATAESGEDTVKETIRRIMKAKGLVTADIGDRLGVSTTLPTLSDAASVREFVAAARDAGATIVVCDPLYLMLGDVDARSLYEMGKVLGPLSAQLGAIGTTLVLLHHANGRSEVGKPMQLDHLSYSGVAQFCRQFVLLSRRQAYRGDGSHELFMNVGGSAGHTGLYDVDIREGVLDDNFAGRTWEVTVTASSEGGSSGGVDVTRKKDETARKNQNRDDADFFRAIEAEVAAGFPGATKKAIQKHYPRFNNNKVKLVAERLLDDGLIRLVRFTKTSGNGKAEEVEGFARVERPHWHGGNGGNPPVESPRLWGDEDGGNGDSI